MEPVFLDLMESLMGEVVRKYESQAILLARQYGGDVIKYRGIRLSFRGSNKKPAPVPPCPELVQLRDKFIELKTDYDALYAFVEGMKNFLKDYKNPFNWSPIYLQRYMLPDDLRYAIGVRYDMQSDSLDALREQFIKKHFVYDVKRVLIKYRLLKQ